MPGPGRLLGDKPLTTVIWLVVLSVLVGFVFATIGLDPISLLRGIISNIDRIIDSIASLLDGLLRHAVGYFLIGVVVVVPLWLIGRLISSRK